MTDDSATGRIGAVPSVEDTSSSASSATDRVRDTAGTAADEARGVARTAMEETKSVAGTAASQARVVAEDAKIQARQLANDARGQLRTQLNEQASRLATSLDDVGRQLRTMSEKADDPESPVTRMTRQAAGSIEDVAGRLEQGGFDQVLDDVKRFARNQPGVFLLGGLGVGFVVGRVLKAADLGQVAKGDSGVTHDTGGDGSRELADPATLGERAAFPGPGSYAEAREGSHRDQPPAGEGLPYSTSGHYPVTEQPPEESTSEWGR